MAEHNVGVGPNEAVYVIRTAEDTQVISWDEVAERIQSYPLELLYRDAEPVERGTVATNDLMRSMEQALLTRCRRVQLQNARPSGSAGSDGRAVAARRQPVEAARAQPSRQHVNITNSDAVRLSGNAVCQTTFANVIHRVLSTGESRQHARLTAA